MRTCDSLRDRFTSSADYRSERFLPYALFTSFYTRLCCCCRLRNVLQLALVGGGRPIYPGLQNGRDGAILIWIVVHTSGYSNSGRLLILDLLQFPLKVGRRQVRMMKRWACSCTCNPLPARGHGFVCDGSRAVSKSLHQNSELCFAYTRGIILFTTVRHLTSAHEVESSTFRFLRTNISWRQLASPASVGQSIASH